MSEVTTSAAMLPNQSDGPQVSKPVRVRSGHWLSIYLEIRTRQSTIKHTYLMKIGRSLAGRSKQR
jgi:hypothetical protein